MQKREVCLRKGKKFDVTDAQTFKGGRMANDETGGQLKGF